MAVVDVEGDVVDNGEKVGAVLETVADSDFLPTMLMSEWLETWTSRDEAALEFVRLVLMRREGGPVVWMSDKDDVRLVNDGRRGYDIEVLTIVVEEGGVGW